MSFIVGQPRPVLSFASLKGAGHGPTNLPGQRLATGA